MRAQCVGRDTNIINARTKNKQDDVVIAFVALGVSKHHAIRPRETCYKNVWGQPRTDETARKEAERAASVTIHETKKILWVADNPSEAPGRTLLCLDSPELRQIVQVVYQFIAHEQLAVRGIALD